MRAGLEQHRIHEPGHVHQELARLGLPARCEQPRLQRADISGGGLLGLAGMADEDCPCQVGLARLGSVRGPLFLPELRYIPRSARRS
jgi:hypothetical protein